MGVQQRGEDDADPVQGHLEGEDPQQPDGDVQRLGVLAGDQQGRQRAGGEREQAAQGDQDEQHPGEQHRRGVVGAISLPGADPVGDERHRGGGQHSPGRHLEDDVGEGVDALVDRADATAAHRVREDEVAREPRDP